jgi:hypothetical protein
MTQQADVDQLFLCRIPLGAFYRTLQLDVWFIVDVQEFNRA